MEKKAEHGGWQEMLHGLFQKKNWLFFVGLAGICLIFIRHSVRRPGRVPRARRGRAHSRL
mgnify:CR=1 FL=1